MSIPDITRDESADRARLLRVDSYDIELDLTAGTELFGSVSVIRFSCAEPGASSYVDLIANQVHRVTLNGTVLANPGLDSAAVGDGRIILPALQERNELRVVADCAYSADGTAMYRAVDSADDKVYIYATLCPADARRVYACFDQPDLKATFSFAVTVPNHWIVLSNQHADRPAVGEPDSVTWRFPATPRISTYLTTIVAGEYHLIRSSHSTPDGQVIPLGLACRASLAPHLDAADVLSTTRRGLNFFTALFKSAYPFDKYDQVFVPEFNWGAMENVGCVLHSDRLLFRSHVTDQRYELRAQTILHEMAHMWFGDLVTMKWWGDLWLNEAFAQFCGVLASAEATRFTGAWTSFSYGGKLAGYRQDQLPSTHPVAADVLTVSQALANFDGISYCKGASILLQLVAYLGRENFLAGIRAYFAEHAWGNASLPDLLRALEASSGTDLAGWSKAWLETAGPNTLRAEFSTGPDGTFNSFVVVQQATAEYPTLRPHRIAIGLYRDDGAELARTHRIEVDVSGPRTELAELTGVAEPDLILLNDDDLGYALIRFDPRSLRTVTEKIGRINGSLARAVCWGAAVDMAGQAELPLPSFVRMLTGGMPSEQSVVALQTLADQARWLLARLADPAVVAAAKTDLAAAAAELLRSARPGSDHQLAWAQLLGWTATSPDQLDQISRLLSGAERIEGLAVDTDLRWELLARLAATGRAGDDEIDAELRGDPTDAGRRYAAGCRAAIPDPLHKAAAWATLTERDDLGVEMTGAIGRGFGQAEHERLLRPYAERYFDVLPAIWESRSEWARLQLAELLFPYPAASPELLGRLDGFVAAAERDASLLRVLADARDVVTRALRSRTLGT